LRGLLRGTCHAHPVGDAADKLKDDVHR
jgi:hypothetical protein